MKIYVGVSAGRTYDCDFVHALLGLMRHREVIFQPLTGDALIERSRGRVATRFLEKSDADVLLSIDTDILFRDTDALEICEQAMEHSIVAGLYVTRSRARSFPTSFLGDERVVFGVGERRDPTPVRVRWAATGFLAVHRRVFAALAERPDMPVCHADSPLRHRPFYLPMVVDDDDGKPILLSEDWAFCQRAMEAGYPSYVNPAVRLHHLGLYAYRLEDTLGPPIEETTLALTHRREPGAGRWYQAERPTIEANPGAGAVPV